MEIQTMAAIAKRLGLNTGTIQYHVEMKRLPQPTKIENCPWKLYTKSQADEIIAYFTKGLNKKRKRESAKA